MSSRALFRPSNCRALAWPSASLTEATTFPPPTSNARFTQPAAPADQFRAASGSRTHASCTEVWCRGWRRHALFVQPCCRIQNLVHAGIAKRRTASVYLKQRVDIGMLRERKSGREMLFVHPQLLTLITGRTPGSLASGLVGDDRGPDRRLVIADAPYIWTAVADSRRSPVRRRVKQRPASGTQGLQSKAFG